METKLELYKKAFTESFGIHSNSLEGLKYQDIVEWDSVGHMSLMAALEESFKIEMSIDDIIDFSSFEKGKQILSKYNVDFNE
jgi:acyl carrier protein